MNKSYTLITGASKGIGLELTYLFAKNNNNLILVARSKDLLEKIKDDIVNKYNVEVEVFSCDLTKDTATNDIYNFTKSNNLEVDILAKRVMRDFANMYLNYKTRHGGKGKPTILTFIYSPAAASILGATSDGRNAYLGIAQGITPHYLSMKKGITAAINSCCKLPFECFYGGASSMWDFDSLWINDNIIHSLLKTFIDYNGQIFQGNITPVEELINAKNNPEKVAEYLYKFQDEARFGSE